MPRGENYFDVEIILNMNKNKNKALALERIPGIRIFCGEHNWATVYRIFTKNKNKSKILDCLSGIRRPLWNTSTWELQNMYVSENKYQVRWQVLHIPKKISFARRELRTYVSYSFHRRALH